MAEDPDVQERVQQILKSNEISTIEVSKPIELETDLGNLLVTDKNELNKEIFRSPLNIEWYLQDIARDCVQVLLNKVWDLPSEIHENKIYATLPSPSTRLPREKRIPKPKEPTKWEAYAKEKGLKLGKKKPNKTWDETLKKWIPRYGMKKALAEKTKNWVREVPATADPYEDQFAKASEAKKERIAKNEFQRLRNIARARKLNLPNVGIIEKENKSVGEFEKVIDTARVSTASLGKFQASLPKEKPLMQERKGQKRKKPPNALDSKSLNAEKKMALELLDKINKPQLNTERAVNRQIGQENLEISSKKKTPSSRRSKQGGRKRLRSEQKAIRKGAAPQMGTRSKRSLKKPSSGARSNKGISKHKMGGKTRMPSKTGGGKTRMSSKKGGKTRMPPKKGAHKGKSGKGKR